MRKREGSNFYAEAHGQPQTVLEWIAPAGTDPSDLADEIFAQTGFQVKVAGGVQHGYMNTSKRPDGSLFVAVIAYAPCPADCEHHRGIAVGGGPELKVEEFESKVPEHPQKVLKGNASDNATLRAVGFTDKDSPLR